MNKMRSSTLSNLDDHDADAEVEPDPGASLPVSLLGVEGDDDADDIIPE